MNNDIAEQIAKKEKELEELRAQQKQELLQKLKAARKEVTRLEGQLGGKTRKEGRTTRRKRTSFEERKTRILDALSGKSKELSLTELMKESDLPAASIYDVMKKHPKEIRESGKRKGKRYFLK
jgi:sugar-specific transcriptional regulator TrmB